MNECGPAIQLCKAREYVCQPVIFDLPNYSEVYGLLLMS